MNRLKKTFLAMSTALSLVAASVIMADQHHAESTGFSSTHLNSTTHLLQGKGGNIAVIEGKDGLVVIDAEYASMSDALLAELAEFGGADKLTYLINTHWHGDHTGGNHVLGHKTQIIAHDNVRTRLLTTQEIKMFNMVSEAYPSHALPSVTFDNRMTLHINDETIELVHFANGHTDGDTVVFLKDANIVHMGDHFFSGFFPFVDVDHGGNVVKLADNVKSILSMIDDDTQVIPGHGPLSTKADLELFHSMLLGTIAEVEAMRDADLWLEEMREKGLSEKWDDWADGMLTTTAWIQIINSSLDNPN